MISPLAIDQNKEIDFLRDGGGSIGSEELGQVVTVQVDLLSSAQRVPEPDPLPGISFDTPPDPIQF